MERSFVAEGIERQVHYDAMRNMGCEVGQPGYFIAKTIPFAELVPWLQHWQRQTGATD